MNIDRLVGAAKELERLRDAADARAKAWQKLASDSRKPGADRNEVERRRRELDAGRTVDFGTAINRLCAALHAKATLDVRSTWRLIDTAPKDGTCILLAHIEEGPHSGMDGEMYRAPGHLWWTKAGCWRDGRWRMRPNVETQGKPPTHWIPLPTLADAHFYLPVWDKNKTRKPQRHEA